MKEEGGDMKILTLLTTLLLTVFLVAGCQSSDQKASDNKTDKTAAKKDSAKDSSKDQANSDQSASSDSGDSSTSAADDSKVNNEKTSKVVQKAMASIKTSLTKRAPSYLPVDPSQSLTAAVSGDSSQYKMVFYTTDQLEAVNSEKVKAMSEDEALAVFSAQTYPTVDKAKAAVKPQSEADGNVDLGHNITAKASSDSKQTSFVWNQGNWTDQLFVPLPLTNFGQEIGKQMVTYLNANTLPEPKSSGRVSVTYGKNKPDTVILFQDDKTVYTLKTSADPMEALKMEVSLKTYK